MLHVDPQRRASLRAELTRLSRAARRPSVAPGTALDRPLHERSDRILFAGAVRRRKRVILLTTGCHVETCTMCPFPSEALPQVTEEHLIAQLDASLGGNQLDGHEVVTLFCNGSFFHDAEISPRVRAHAYSRVARSDARFLVVETLARFVTADALAQADALLEGKTLTAFMGLQSVTDAVREVAVNTTTTRADFERATKELHARGHLSAAFLMVKPPFLTEREGVTDALASLRYLAELGVGVATLCPARIAPDTLLEELHRAGLYAPLWTWSVLDVLTAYGDAPGVLPMVNTTELKPASSPGSVCAQACPRCADRLVEALEAFLYSRDFALLTQLTCECRARYEAACDAEEVRFGGVNLEARIEEFLRYARSRSAARAQ